MKKLCLLLLTLASALLVSCSSKIDMPKGTSKGYTSARLVNLSPHNNSTPDARERQVHSLIHKSIKNAFESHGMSYGNSNADLTVSYLVLYQEPGMTNQYARYFGYGKNPEEITDRAHIRGVLENERPDYFKRAGLIIDITDNKTGKLVYRNYAVNDVVGATGSLRAQRVDTAVRNALSEFLK